MTAGSVPTVGRRAVGDRAAEVEDGDLVAEPHHEAHVVLDEHHGQVVGVAELAHERHQLVDLAVGQAGGRLVEQQQLRVPTPRPGPARRASACRTATRRRGGRRPSTTRPPRARRRPGPAPAAPRCSTHGARTALLTQSDLRTRWSPTITFSRTVRRGNSARFWNVREICFWATLCGGMPSSSSPFQRMLPRLGPVDAGEAVEQRRLAGAVGPDEPGDLARDGPAASTWSSATMPPKRTVTSSTTRPTRGAGPDGPCPFERPDVDVGVPAVRVQPVDRPLAVPHVVSPVSSSRPLPPDRPGSRHCGTPGGSIAVTRGTREHVRRAAISRRGTTPARSPARPGRPPGRCGRRRS